MTASAQKIVLQQPANQLREIENIIEVNYDEFKDAWERHCSS